MSSVVMEGAAPQVSGRPVIMDSGDRGPVRERRRGPQVWLASIIAWVMARPARDQRGITTIEYIFGAILAIAIITVVVAVVRNPVVGEMILTLIQWVLKFRGK